MTDDDNSTDLLKEISGKLDDVRNWQTGQEKVCEHARHKLDLLGDEVWGNGRDGLKRRVDRLTDRGKLLWATITISVGLAGVLVGLWAKG